MSRISVIIPTYNYAAYILESVTSVLDQLQTGDELIVVDDGSEDETGQILKSLIDAGRIVYEYQNNTGVSGARNRGVEIASNQYLYFLDADDRIAENGLEKLRQLASQHPEAAMVFGGHISIFENGERRIHLQKTITGNAEQNFYDYVIKRRFSIANGGTALIKREVALKHPFPVDLKVSEDFCVFAWILANYQCYSFEQPVVEVRKHSGSLAGQETTAKATYKKALACRPVNIFKLSYLRKYIRLLLA